MNENAPAVLSRFGKPSAVWFDMKDFFYSRDQELAGHAQKIAEAYTRQPPRTQCKICTGPLSAEGLLTKNGVRYTVCGACGHFNGLHEDTDAFNQAVYVEEGSKIYQIAYSSEDRGRYATRVEQVYLPKAAFLADALRHDGCQPDGLRVDDFGAGSGYFVSALRTAGFAAQGYEVSAEQVAFAAEMVGPGALRQVGLNDTLDLIAASSARVLSFIFVLEHVADPLAVLRAAAANPAVEYVYFSVPMFSASVFFETAFPQYYHRHLSAGHTHLFTDQSLGWIEQALSFRRVGEWWFGLDMVDLVRLLGVHFAANPETTPALPLWNEMMRPVLDAMQQSLDARRQASEVHMLWKVKP